MHTTDSRYH